MSDRLYFLFGDVLSNALVGGVAAALAAFAIPAAWSMVPGMLVAMLLGMAVASVLAFPLMRWFGAMEVMLPTMLGGMLAAMVAGMQAAMAPLGAAQAALEGALIGLAALAFTAYVDHLLRMPREDLR